jgi:predicted Zn finger-like uncharacterized protein
MVVQCSSCLTEFELDPAKVPALGVRARCSVCSAVITVPAPPAKAAPVHVKQKHEEEPAKQPDIEKPAPPSATEAPAPAAAAPAAAASATPTPEAPSWRSAAPSSPPASQPTTSFGGAAPAAPAEYAPSRSWSAPAAEAPAPAVAPTAPHAEPEGQRRSINPFLTRDPALRAKRLARALVSDIVAYHPARHAEGLRDGTLKTLFRDEIKKSYEEYVDQVGRDFAGSTTHFQDALNDVLASGKKLF